MFHIHTGTVLVILVGSHKCYVVIEHLILVCNYQPAEQGSLRTSAAEVVLSSDNNFPFHNVHIKWYVVIEHLKREIIRE
ncbi:hypothetical protein A0J51_02937 [Gluconobacter japonicus]|uniref:Uncharacterized protein n=1 Tax=Gluconobacter cerinus TaxID=38307 RepID=A0A1B6VI72_9PROT|nr:hypothetical protein [Gluconobacter cerinus]OAG71929.1 hypothetical protein A0J51_02937 [Gluconobacter japonicus]OAJ66910.1 hypothetical protein A0123_02447 [Gluconobacter cerinus]